MQCDYRRLQHGQRKLPQRLQHKVACTTHELRLALFRRVRTRLVLCRTAQSLCSVAPVGLVEHWQGSGNFAHVSEGHMTAPKSKDPARPRGMAFVQIFAACMSENIHLSSVNFLRTFVEASCRYSCNEYRSALPRLNFRLGAGRNSQGL